MIKTFKGQLDSNDGNSAQDTIRLSTTDGKTGYRIVKFQIFPQQPGAVNTEAVVKVFKRSQTTIDGLVNFDDQALLAAAFYAQASNVSYTPNAIITIFDTDVFNQDIFVVYDEIGGTEQIVNYYLELEQFKLDLSEATVATLKDMRGTN